jgi:hypothetical protein
MKDTKLYWAAIAVVAAVGILLFVNSSDKSIEQENSVASSPEDYQPPVAVSEPMPSSHQAPAQTKPAVATATDNSEPGQVTLEERLSAMQQRRPEQNFDPVAVAEAAKRQTAWAEAEEVPKHLPLKPEEFTDGRQFIELDSLKIETLMPGDDFNITIEETGQDYVVTMDRVEKHDYNSISWYGHINGDDGQSYAVSFTRGQSLTVGGMETPDGHYVLQAHGDNGWLASSGLLFKVDPNVDDAIYPDGTGHQHDDGHAH